MIVNETKIKETMKTPSEQYIRTLKGEFAIYGFSACPLSDDEIAQLMEAGFSIHSAYRIGCDVNAGFSLSEAILAEKQAIIDGLDAKMIG